MFRHHYSIAEGANLRCSNCGACSSESELLDVSDSEMSNFLPIGTPEILCVECLKSLESQL